MTKAISTKQLERACALAECRKPLVAFLKGAKPKGPSIWSIDYGTLSYMQPYYGYQASAHHLPKDMQRTVAKAILDIIDAELKRLGVSP